MRDLAQIQQILRSKGFERRRKTRHGIEFTNGKVIIRVSRPHHTEDPHAKQNVLAQLRRAGIRL